jgi:two-component system sensor histidine kinase HydH
MDNGIDHFTFPLTEKILLINDLAVRRDILDLLPVPMALAVGDKWVWMNQAARATSIFGTSPPELRTNISEAAGEEVTPYIRSVTDMNRDDIQFEPVYSLEGDRIGHLAWPGQVLAAWAMDQLETAVLVAQDQLVVWSNEAARRFFHLPHEAKWKDLKGFPDWKDVLQGVSIRRIGEFVLRCEAVGPHVVAEYWNDSLRPNGATWPVEQVVSMVHEIRNPLAALSGYVEMVQSSASPQTLPYYEKMLQEIHRISRLTADLMSISRLPEIVPQWTPLDDVVDSAWMTASRGQSRFHNSKASLAMVLRKNYASDEKIWADPDRLLQVLTNLIKNSIEAADDRGGWVEVGLRHARQAVILTVRDNGPGIPPTSLATLSLVRYTTKKSGGGLGLMIVRHIVEAHGGTLRIISKDGTTVQLTFPQPRP